MQEKYIILIDVDETLVENGKTKVSSKVLESLEYARSKGNILAISTGRSVVTTKAIDGYKHFDYIACLMGSVIYSTKEDKIIFEDKNKINSEYVKPLIEYFIDSKCEWTYKDDNEDKSTLDISKFGNRFNAKIITKDEVNKDIENNKIFQLLASKNAINDEIIDTYKDLDFVFMPGDYYDILKKGSSKANVVKYFKQHFPKYKIVAIGDSNNDIPMLKTADISIAMGNANQTVLNMCNFTTKTLKEDGVSYAIREILKI